MLFCLIISTLLNTDAKAKKFKLKSGDVIEAVFKIGVVLPLEYTSKVKKKDLENLKKEPVQLYPVAVDFRNQTFNNCNGIGYVIYNPPLRRFFGVINKISCEEKGKIKNYKTKAYILDSKKNLGVNPVAIKPSSQLFLLFVEKITSSR